MYNTKVFSERARDPLTGTKVPFLAASGEQYKETAESAIAKGSKYKGKQFQTRPPIRPGGSDVGFFGKIEYKPEKFDDTSGYLKTQPLDKRRLGFGSHLPHCRDQFTKHIEVERYRESVRREMKGTAPMKALTARTTRDTPKRHSRAEMLSSSMIGFGAWDVDRPAYGRVATTKSFQDRSHVDG